MRSFGLFSPYLAALLTALAGCNQGHEASRIKPESKPTVAWQHGDVGLALAQAKALHRPALVYWGAKWCAPCSRLKATLFINPDFVKLSRSVVAIHLDGDDKGAQAWGDRFKISGYPTLILLDGTGKEVARPDTNENSATVVRTLVSSLGRVQSPSDLIDRAISGPRTLSAADWAAVARIDWRTFAFSGGKPQQNKLRLLAAVVPDAVLARRIALYSLASHAHPKQTNKFEPVVPSAIKRGDLELALWKYSAHPIDISQEAVLTWFIAARLLAAQPHSARKDALRHKLLIASNAYRASPAVSAPDKIDSWMIDLTLVRDNRAAVPLALKDVLRVASNAALSAETEVELRQSILHEAALLRRDAGDLPGVQRMLLDNIGKLANPEDAYERLSENAEMRGQPVEAVAWLRRRYDSETGRSSKLRFALEYSRAAMRLAPGDAATVDRSIRAVYGAAARSNGDLSDRMRQDQAEWLREARRWSNARGGHMGFAVGTT